MCTEYGFSKSQYLRFASDAFFSMSDALRFRLEKSRNMERVYFVLSTLPEENVEEKIKEYVYSEVDRILELIVSEAEINVLQQCKQLEVNDFFKELRNQMQNFLGEVKNIWETKRGYRAISIDNRYQQIQKQLKTMLPLIHLILVIIYLVNHIILLRMLVMCNKLFHVIFQHLFS